MDEVTCSTIGQNGLIHSQSSDMDDKIPTWNKKMTRPFYFSWNCFPSTSLPSFFAF
jgi:hypothetical protein